MIDDNDMVEVNLSSSELAKIAGEMDAAKLLHDSPCLTKSFSINDLKDRALQHRLKSQPKYATIAGVKGKGSDNECERKLESPSISCLRQMYCPDCHQRLDADSVRFETLLSCCLPLFPLKTVYQCCLRRSIGRKVICNKCGSNLGYWKRS
uniref:LITAF domain-containing protein n=1 Tax=Stomoxys calcitrans TaxID=35570 RepID=A0A1I8PL16_STOCA